MVSLLNPHNWNKLSVPRDPFVIQWFKEYTKDPLRTWNMVNNISRGQFLVVTFLSNNSLSLVAANPLAKPKSSCP